MRSRSFPSSSCSASSTRPYHAVARSPVVALVVLVFLVGLVVLAGQASSDTQLEIVEESFSRSGTTKFSREALES